MSEFPMRCSFCGADQKDVEVLVANVGANICEQCIDVCAGVVDDFRAKEQLKKSLEASARDFILLGQTLGLEDGIAMEAIWEASQQGAA